MMITFFDTAQVELEEATQYYENQRAGLGEEFAQEVEKALDRISKFPRAWTDLGEGVRRCRTNRFPYGLVYIIENEVISIVAVMHLHREPGYWKDRL
jgi:plasmid stabilization system protein ParE